jgi:PKD repeat protein
LNAANDGPTALGSATTFSATIFVSDTVTFSWDFGDGMNGSGANPSHVYSAPGVFTATVMAQYGTASQTAETVVIVEEAISGLTASNNGPTTPGEATTLMATITAGTDVSYTWNLGDGSTGSGAVVMHTYPGEGMYTAVVTATNLVSSDTATTTVVVEVTEYEVYLPAVVGKPGD